MLDWRTIAVAATTPIIKVLEIMNQTALSVALVVNENEKLIGIVTDGDIRRGMLRRVDMNDPVEKIMNKNPIVASVNDANQELIARMRKLQLRHMPILDENHRMAGVETIEHLLLNPTRDNWVVLMAGGMGARLKPLTDDCPKPLLRIGTKPVLQIVLESFIEHGFQHFYFAINYKGNLIKDYFGDGSRFDVNIQYLCEEERLGTAGALSLLPEKPTLPLLVMNADLMTKVNFQQLLDFHEEHGASATICVREYTQAVPYGVVDICRDKYQLLDIKEKPEHHFFVNAGIYVLNPDVLQLVPAQSFYDMPDLLETLIKNKQTVSTFPIREYWLDIGRLEDLERAHQDYSEVFA